MKYCTFLFALLLLNCSLDGTDPEDITCTDVFVYGLHVTIRDNTTNQPITDNLTVIARDGAYEEELESVEGSDFFVGAGERGGVYIIEVTSPNYQDYTSGSIQVNEDQCHVITQRVEILLQPN